MPCFFRIHLIELSSQSVCEFSFLRITFLRVKLSRVAVTGEGFLCLHGQGVTSSY